MPKTDSDLGVLFYVYDQEPITGYISEGSYISASIPTTASKFALGCKVTNRATGIVYFNSGTVAVPVWSRLGASAVNDPQGLQMIEVDLTAADIIATAAGSLSHANGLILAPVPATGYMNVLHRVVVSFTYATAAFTGGGNTTVNIGGGGAALTGLIATTSLFTKGSSTIIQFVPLSTVGFPVTKETSINLVTASAITNPGTAAGSAKVYCWYSVVAI